MAYCPRLSALDAPPLPYSSRLTANCSLPITHCPPALPTLLCRRVTARDSLPTTCCPQHSTHTAWCPRHAAHDMLPTTCCPQLTAGNLLRMIHCSGFTAHNLLADCLLPTTYSLQLLLTITAYNLLPAYCCLLLTTNCRCLVATPTHFSQFVPHDSYRTT
jgi:hypothetical protein